MFREISRKNRKMVNYDTIKVLKTQKRGVLSVIGDEGYPYGMPMNHYYNEEDGCIYFHTGLTGHRTDSIKKCDKVSFCVYDEGYTIGDDWALNIKSVIVFGRIEIITDKEIIKDIVTKLCHKFTTDEEYISKEFASAIDHTLLLKLVPENICGKIVTEA